MSETALRAIAADVQGFLDDLDEGHTVLAVGTHVLAGEKRDKVLAEYPTATHTIRILECIVHKGRANSSNIMGQEIPARVDEDGIELLEEIPEEYGGGPDIQDVCVGRALAWIGEDALDIEVQWRHWPSEDRWYTTYKDKDYSTK